MAKEMLAPAAALVVWTLIVMIWAMATRMGGFKQAGISLDKAPPGGRGVNLEGVLPDQINWKAHNYTHLVEQPTIFYPTVLILAAVGAQGLDVVLAWIYVAIRVVHSIWQATVNRIPVRANLFFASSIVLVVLALRALWATLA